MQGIGLLVHKGEIRLSKETMGIRRWYFTSTWMQTLSCCTFFEVLVIKQYHSPGNNKVSPQQYRPSCTPPVECNPMFMS